jgi:eukaryotic-like serine/threonine-protein kinase
MTSPGKSSAAGLITLRSLLNAQGKLPFSDACRFFAQLARDTATKLARAEMCILHPSSVHVDPQGRAVLSGHEHPADPKDANSLPPETGSAPVDARGAVYAIGAMFYEATTGVCVGAGMKRPIELGLPPSAETILMRALVADPAGRPADLNALATAFDQLAHSTVTSMPPGGYDIALSMPIPVDASNGFSDPPAPPPSSRAARAPAAPPSMGSVPQAPSSKQRVDAYGNIVVEKAPPVSRPNATDELAQLKARLEADTTPRYVVSKDYMDHGPFSAVELLQQIASNKFVEADGLRDEVTGVSQKISEWPEFARFAEHAKIHRDVAHEKKAVIQLEKSEKKAGIAKYLVGGTVAVALLAGATLYLVKKAGSRTDGSALVDDPNGMDLTSDGGLKGSARAGGGRGGGGRGGGGRAGGGGGGQDYEAALNGNVQEVDMNGGGGPDLTNAQLSAPMRNASFLGSCGAPNDMKVSVRVAVKMGRAVGVSVTTNPPDGAVASCIDRHVRGISWPAHPKMDSFTTNY